jgi:hypothetical protein
MHKNMIEKNGALINLKNKKYETSKHKYKTTKAQLLPYKQMRHKPL